MYSGIFRRNTRKGCGCMQGGRSLNGQIKNNQKSIATLESQLVNKRYAKYTGNIQKSLTARRKHLNELMKQKAADNKAAGEKEATTFFGKLGNMVNAFKKNNTPVPAPVTITSVPSEAVNMKILSSPTRTNIVEVNTQPSQLTPEIITVQQSSPSNINTKLKNLENRVKTLAANINSMKSTIRGGKRRTQRGSRSHRK